MYGGVGFLIGMGIGYVGFLIGMGIGYVGKLLSIRRWSGGESAKKLTGFEIDLAIKKGK